MLKKFGIFILSAALTLSVIVLFYFATLFIHRRFFFYLIYGLLFIIALVAMREWKRSRASSLGIFLIFCLVVGLLWFSSFQMKVMYSCQGLHNEFDSMRLLDLSDIVAKVKVVSKTNADSMPQDFIRYYFTRESATVELLESIKGKVPSRFVIKFPKDRKRYDCSHMRQGSIAIVFLKKDTDGYRYAERLNEALPLKSEKSSFNFGDSPRDKLLAELMDLVNNSISYQRTNAIKDIGKLKDKRALDLLRKLTNYNEASLESENAFVRGESLTARIRINDAPRTEEFNDFFQYLSKFQNPCLAHDVFKALNESIVVDEDDEKIILEKLYDFDYVDFLNQINVYKSNCLSWDMKEISEIYRKLADKRSIPFLKEMIEDKSFDVRFNVVMALNKIFNEERYEEPKTTKFHNFRVNEKEYLKYWKERLAEL